MRRLRRRMSEKFIARNSPLAAPTRAGETLVMCVADSTFVTLNEAASIIWQAADGRTPLSEIVSRRICPRFEIDPDSAKKDAEQFVADLSGRGLLLVSEHPIDSPISVEVA